jgi:hypothetical protein
VVGSTKWTSRCCDVIGEERSRRKRASDTDNWSPLFAATEAGHLDAVVSDK